MTRREAKAEETARKITRSIIDGNRDWNHFILEAMAWQAEECADNLTVCVLPAMITERQLMAILNAGTEDV